MTALPFAPSVPVHTSERAADAIRARIGSLELTVLRAIVLQPFIGVCAFELEQRLPMNGNTLRPRLRALELDGLIEKSEKVTRATPSGRHAAAYFATPRGRKRIEG